MPTEIFHSWLFSVAVSPMSKIHISYISKKSFSRISVSEGSTWILNKTQEKNWWAFCAIKIKGNLAHLWGRWWLIKKYNLSAYQFSPFFQIFSRYKHFLVDFIFNLIVGREETSALPLKFSSLSCRTIDAYLFHIWHFLRGERKSIEFIRMYHF